ncbi:uncharacterized protein LOC121856949 [Homarus americanus]|uniref:uncharacterized protein LOC121856949 n=1 Tax=Homarus americanus TaxID=6706 RepID=UPI001C44774F|nr:uncharacterized protein LOC121856949 [Homarus americanus]
MDEGEKMKEAITEVKEDPQELKEGKEVVQEEKDGKEVVQGEKDGKEGDLSWVNTFEDLLEVVGTNGRWNILMFIMCVTSVAISPLQTLSYQFLGATPDYWCHIAPLVEANWTDQQILSLAIPYRNTRRPLHMNHTAVGKVKKKTYDFETWVRTNGEQDRGMHAGSRNQTKAESRRAEKEFQRQIASEVKPTPKAFFR